MKLFAFFTAALLAAATAGSAQAQPPATQSADGKIIVTDAWIRTTIPGSDVSAAFMRIQSPAAVRLLTVETPLAGDVQIHDMKIIDGIMYMKELPGVDIPAGQKLELKPGGKHVMLRQVKKTIGAGDKVPLTLTFAGAGKKKITIKVDAIARERSGAGSTH